LKRKIGGEVKGEMVEDAEEVEGETPDSRAVWEFWEMNRQRLLQTLFPPVDEEAAPSVNAIKHVSAVVYGGQGSGKTNTFRYMVREALCRFGPENVNVAYAQFDVKPLIQSVRDRFVNVLICEDMTMQEQDEEALRDFFNVRHVIRRETGRNTGLVLTLFSVHDLFGLQPKAMRTVSDLVLFRETPFAEYDQSRVRAMVGDELYDEFVEMEKKRATNPLFTGVTMCRDKWDSWLVYIPKVYMDLDAFLVEPPRNPPSAKNQAAARESVEKGDRVMRAVLTWIHRGYDRCGELAEILHVTQDSLREYLRWLEERGLVAQAGWPRRRYMLTVHGLPYVKGLFTGPDKPQKGKVKKNGERR
jgi:DNA-binding transcriptional ArsR family regulator